MKSDIYEQYAKKLDAAIASQNFIAICKLLLRAFFTARKYGDILVVTNDWFRRALLAIAHGPQGNPYNPKDKTDSFYPCSLEDADKTSNYVALIMIVVYLDVEYSRMKSNPRIFQARQILHMTFGDKPCWMRFRSVCFRLLFSEAQLTSGFHYTGELFFIMANFMKLKPSALKQLDCPNVSICEKKCEEIMRLGEYIKFARRFVNEDGKTGVGYPVLEVLVQYAERFLYYYSRTKANAALKARYAEWRRIRDMEPRSEKNVIKDADFMQKTCEKFGAAITVVGGKTVVRSVLVRKQQEKPRERTAAEKVRARDHAAVVKEINRRYADPNNRLSIPKIISIMRNSSAYAARMSDVTDVSWKKYAAAARRNKSRDEGKR